MVNRIICEIALAFSLTLASAATPLYPPHHNLKLTLNEFSILNVAEMDGLMKYGGSGDFQLKMSKEGNEVLWTITIDNPRLMELLGIFIGEKAIKLVQNLDSTKIDPNQALALEAVKSLSLKMEQAQANPVWDSVRLSGAVVQQGADWLLKTADEDVRLVGPKLAELQKENGKVVLADGYVKKLGEFEVTRFLEKRSNTLEMFVMSFCPFGQAAQTGMMAYLADLKSTPPPSLELHYIFYKQVRDGTDVFFSMHGDEEVTENLVQIVIRDTYPEYFQAYLLLRAESGNKPWKQLIEKVGLTAANAENIDKTITAKRDELIRREYEYATGRYDISDGSPTYVWESERVTNLRKVPVFKDFSPKLPGSCAH